MTDREVRYPDPSGARRLEGRVAIVTGAAHGIGRAAALRLGAEGARVGLLDVDGGQLARTVDDVGADRAIGIDCDIRDDAEVRDAVGQVVDRFGRLDVVASVAGGSDGSADPLDPDHWRRILAWNLEAPVRLIRACLPHLTAAGGSIVLVGSVNGIAAYGEPAYSAAKAALTLVVRNLAVEYGPAGVRANVVAPGTVRTRVWDRQVGGADRMRPLYPLGRVGEPADIAAAIAFLASDDAAWITGVTLPVDGGSLAGPAQSLRSRE